MPSFGQVFRGEAVGRGFERDRKRYPRRDSNPRSSPRQGDALAAGPQGCESGRLELNQRSPPCESGEFPLLHGPVFIRIGPAGVEPAPNRISDGCLAARPRPEIPTECPAGVAPACPTWHAGTSLLGHGHKKTQRWKESNLLGEIWSFAALRGHIPI
jgi:hypothetical protein